MKIVFSIVSHNQQRLVQNLLDSMSIYLNAGDHEFVCVITENTLNEVKLDSNSFELNVHVNLRQTGFGSNHNHVFEHYDSHYFFIINPDIVFKETVNLDDIIEEMENQKIHIASPKILNANGDLEDYKRADLTLKNLIYRKLFGKKEQDFHWFAGMFLIVNSESFRALNGFDTKFYMYVEDCDLCDRARCSDLNVEDCSGFSVIHNARRASRKNLQHLVWHVESLIKYWFGKLRRYFNNSI